MQEVCTIKKTIIGVMGGSQFISPEDEKYAYQIGAMIAQEGWILLNGGRASGVMEASARGAKDYGGMTIGILPTDEPHWASQYIDIPIVTGMGMARNVINILSSDIIVALPGKAGTISEIALALNYGKEVILFRFDAGNWLKPYQEEGKVHFINEVACLRSFLKEKINSVYHS
ncbi:MAG: Rossmann fold nucleotide-binding protein [Atribacteria bacterium 34_128]|nr:MAG: Rossmann fold nucleotide-binding protein [Atribacteria bacterium 34_128]